MCKGYYWFLIIFLLLKVIRFDSELLVRGHYCILRHMHAFAGDAFFFLSALGSSRMNYCESSENKFNVNHNF